MRRDRGLLLAVLLAVGLPCGLGLSCGYAQFGGRRETGPAFSGDAAAFTAAVSQPLDQQGLINAAVQTAVEAAFAKVGNAGRDINTYDSWSFKVLIVGMLGLFWYSLRQRSRGNLAEKAVARIAGTIEKARTHEACACGACADCIVDKLRKHGDKVEFAIRRMVKSAGE